VVERVSWRPMTLPWRLEALGALVCASALTLPARPGPGAIVDYRTAVMKSLGGHMRALTLITAGGVGYADQASLHARSIEEIARVIPSLFPVGTGPGSVKTDALDTIWKDEAGFKAAAEKLRAGSASLARAAKGTDAAALKAQAEVVARACSACHDAYRVSR
jgi:cytochrome c556